MSALATVVRPLFTDPFTIARQMFEELPTYLLSEEGRSMNHSEMERELEQRGRELMRVLYQGWLDQQAPGQTEDPVVDDQGNERTRKRIGSRDLATVFGTVTVRRMGYGGEREESLHPLDARLNLPQERYSHELRRRAAEEASRSSFDETVKTLASYTGTRIAKRQVEQLVGRAAQDFDAFYEARQQATEETPDTSSSVLVLTADGKGVVMHREDLRPATQAAAARKQARLEGKLSRSEKRDRKRMATVVAVYTVAPYVRTPEEVYHALAREPDSDQDSRPKPATRPRPEHKRVWASLEKDPEEVIEEAFCEALNRDPDRTKTWAVVVDGNEHQLDIFERLEQQHDVRLTIVLDVMHVLGYVWKAGRALEGEDDEDVEQWVLERMLRILEGRATHVAAGMRRSATRRHLTSKERKPVDRCADYLLKYSDYMNYNEYLAAGVPIGSGVIEGACRHLVKDRMEITGARWRLSGADAVLRLRALRCSGDFDEYWRFHEAREHDRNHRARYAEGEVPKTDLPRAKLAPKQPRPSA